MSSIIRVNDIQDAGGNSIVSSDGSGTFSNNLGIDNTPSWHAFLSSSQDVSNNTTTVIIFNHEALDTNSAYDTSTGRFTVPSGGAGKYVIYSQLMRNNFFNSRYLARIRVNGSDVSSAEQRNTDTGGTTYQTVNVQSIQTLAEGDYVDVTLYQNSGGSAGAYGTNTTNGKSIFLGHRLLGI